MPSRIALILPAAAITALAVAACGGATTATSKTAQASRTASRSAPSTAAQPAVKAERITVSQNGTSTHRQVLVDAKGQAVYLLTGDSTAHALCTSASCLSAWPAVTVSARAPKLGSGVHAKLSVWVHKGLRQLVLDGHPLYLFAGDGSVGTANGEGIKSFGGTWLLLTAGGQAVKPSA